MWQLTDIWLDLKPGDKWWMGVSVAMGVTGALICIISVTVLIGSGQLLNSVSGAGSLLVDAQETIAGDTATNTLPDAVGSATDQLNSGMVVVDVSGGVNSPGLYQIASGSRVGEAIELAGGLATSAATRQIAQEVNLAALVQDGQKIFIPIQDDSIANTGGINAGVATQSPNTKSTSANLVSINSATKSELDALPGIGEKRAEAIISGRPYLSIEELVSEGAVTVGVLDDIRSLISL